MFVKRIGHWICNDIHALVREYNWRQSYFIYHTKNKAVSYCTTSVSIQSNERCETTWYRPTWPLVAESWAKSLCLKALLIGANTVSFWLLGTSPVVPVGTRSWSPTSAVAASIVPENSLDQQTTITQWRVNDRRIVGYRSISHSITMFYARHLLDFLDSEKCNYKVFIAIFHV